MSRSTSFAGVINSITYKLNILLFSSHLQKLLRPIAKEKASRVERIFGCEDFGT